MPRLTNGLEQVLTNLGIVGSGYKLFFFETGTTTLKTTYSDEDLTVANTNPIVLNSAGRPDVDVWGSDPSLYRMILGTPNSVVGNITTVVDVDPVDNYQVDNLATFNPIPTAYWGATAGTSTAYTLEEPLVDITSYSNTQTFFVDIHIACGASPTFKVKDLPAITLKKYKGDGTTTDLVANDLQIQRYLCVNNGTNIVVLNPRYPENLDATTEKKGVSFLPKVITIANNSGTPNTIIDFGAGVAQADDGSLVFTVSATSKILQNSGAWAAGNNQNGLDTGARANSTYYYCFAIYNPTTLASDFLFSASKASPTLPSGYTKKCYLGACHTDGSANIRSGAWKYGNGIYDFRYTTNVIDINNASATEERTVLSTISAPANSKVTLNVALSDTSLTAGQVPTVLFTEINQTDSLPDGINQTLRILGNAGSAYNENNLWIGYVNSSRQIRLRTVDCDSSCTIFGVTIGWTEYL